MSTLHYKAGASIGDLAVGECVIRGARNSDGSAHWKMLWFRVLRATDGVAETFAVAINPGGSYAESGPGGQRTWGLSRVAPGAWQVSPSINATTSAIAPGHRSDLVSLWHETPQLLDVPEPPPWSGP